jgi:hypothetical protein
MKNVLAGLLTLFVLSISFGAANVVIPATTFDANGCPSNIAVFKLGTGNSGALDTFLVTGSAKCYGPFNLSKDNSRPQYKGFRVYPALTSFASGDSLKVEYQLLPTNKMSDTTSTWVSVTAVMLRGVPSSYIDISALPGQSIVIKITCIDVITPPIIMAAPVRVVFFESSAAVVDTKR